MTGLKIEGVVFDVDGVLFDTERLTQQTWLAVSREMGWPQVGEAYLEFVGQNRADIFQKMEDLFGAEFPKDAFIAACSARSQARMETEGVPMKPGVGEVLELLRSRGGSPPALATSTGRPRTERADGDDRAWVPVFPPSSPGIRWRTASLTRRSTLWPAGPWGPPRSALWRWRTPETASSLPPGRGCGWPWSPTCCPHA